MRQLTHLWSYDAGALLLTGQWPVWPAFYCSRRLPLLILGLYTSADLSSVDLSHVVRPSAVEYEGSCRLVSDQFRCIISEIDVSCLLGVYCPEAGFVIVLEVCMTWSHPSEGVCRLD